MEGSAVEMVDLSEPSVTTLPIVANAEVDSILLISTSILVLMLGLLLVLSSSNFMLSSS